VLHCHILAHEDRGMMTVVEVAPLQTPFSHH
jgi:FtsP/CotA-like multicopper oxidase with cupredoxin domain